MVLESMKVPVFTYTKRVSFQKKVVVLLVILSTENTLVVKVISGIGFIAF